MAGQSLVFSESIDDVLKVVQETPRGRWFIEAYTQRLKSEGTDNILTAIAKLENHISSISNSDASAEVLQKARSAIAQARQEIADLEPKNGKLSSEARLFANLADMSRKAFGESHDGKGVERALKLVADLDRDLNTSNAAEENLIVAKPDRQYFKQDEAIFEPTPAPSLIVQKPVAAKTVDVPEVSNKGAKLVIRRLSAPETTAPMIAEPIVEETPLIESPDTIPEASKVETTVAETVAITTTPAAESAPIVENSRIVIIRRKADEAMAVPLFDAEAEVSAA